MGCQDDPQENACWKLRVQINAGFIDLMPEEVERAPYCQTEVVSWRQRPFLHGTGILRCGRYFKPSSKTAK